MPHVYLYSAAALRGLSSDLEEAARVSGANPFRVAVNVSLPMILPAILFAGVLVFFLGFELFGLPLVLGDPQDVLVLSTYLYKLTNKLGVPSYQLMAVVVVVIIAVTAPLVFMQRMLLRQTQRYVSVRGKGLKTQPLRLHGWRWFAFGVIVFWLFVTVVVPLFGITLRSFVVTWGEGVKLLDVLTLDHYRELTEYPNVIRGIINTLGIGVIGGAVAVAWRQTSQQIAGGPAHSGQCRSKRRKCVTQRRIRNGHQPREWPVELENKKEPTRNRNCANKKRNDDNGIGLHEQTEARKYHREPEHQ